MKTQTLTLDDHFGSDYQGNYVFGEITWAKRSRIIQKNTKYHPVTGKVVESDFVDIQAETIWASLRSQPESKPLTLEKLQGETEGIPIQLGEYLSKVVNKLCGLTKREEDFLSSPFDAKPNTQSSPSSGSAKNSVGPPTNSTANRIGASNSSSLS